MMRSVDIGLACVLPLTLMVYISRLDAYRRPRRFSALAIVFAGSLAVILALYGNAFLFSFTTLDMESPNPWLRVLTSFLVPGFMEEWGKLIAITASFALFEQPRTRFDLIQRCLGTGVIFACIENIVVPEYFKTEVLIMRNFTAIPLHMVTGLIMSVFVSKYLWKEGALRSKLGPVFLALTIPALIHGAYDATCGFLLIYLLGLVAVVAFIVIFLYQLRKYVINTHLVPDFYDIQKTSECKENAE
jgi:RsiW-degrading membrane proteinase PrsW (M82 family)